MAGYDGFLRSQRTYSFYACTYSADSLRDLRIMTQLVELDASESMFDDAGMSAVSRMNALESLNLADSMVTDRGISELFASGASHGPRESLRWLNISRTRVTSLVGISALVNLTTLFALRLQLHRDGISELGQLRALRRLDLRESSIGTDDLQTLRGHPCLEELNIQGTDVDDDIYEVVMQIAQLKWVALTGSLVSADVCERIYRDHPRLRQSAGII